MAKTATGSSSQALFLLISLSCMLAAQASSPYPFAPPYPFPTRHEPIVEHIPISYFDMFPPLAKNDPTINKCVESVKRISTCASEVLISILSGKPDINFDCCAVIQGLGGRCISAIFPFIPANPSYAGLMKDLCRHWAPPVGRAVQN